VDVEERMKDPLEAPSKIMVLGLGTVGGDL